MIIAIAGGVGSGKSVTAVKHAVEESKNNPVLTNFKLKDVPNHYRLKKQDIIQITTEMTEKGKVTEKKSVNWDFWNEHRGTDVFLDEVHNLISSRNSTSKDNRLYSEWVSQIRKVWGASGDCNYIHRLKKMNNNTFTKIWDRVLARSNNLYFISQRMRKADVNFRDLTHVLIQCKKQKVGRYVIINNLIWFGDDNMSAIEAYEYGTRPKIHRFLANPYFKHYNSYDIIGMGGEYL